MFNRSMSILFIVLIIASMFLGACDRKPVDSTAPVSTSAPAVGEKQINEGINEFFQNSEQCSGIVC